VARPVVCCRLQPSAKTVLDGVRIAPNLDDSFISAQVRVTSL